MTLVFSRFRFVSFKKALLLSFSIFLSVQTKAKIKVMRIFAYAAKMHWVDFLKPIIFQIKREYIKDISISLFIVPFKHDKNA